ncbi:MAG: Lrp/AsnC family transcriptional regulator [Chryseobacterium sp.]|nr:MAG: Lrp/AsnC family transcriptional regulator [Chryseobacterium sp.]
MSKKHERLDQTDIDILNILQEDGSRTQKEIAGILRRPISGIYDRLKKLERLCCIDRYNIRLDRSKLQKSFDVQILVRLRNNDPGSITAFKISLQTFSSIYECCHISGEWDFILKANFRYMDDMRHLLEQEFDKSPLIKRTSQLIILTKTEFKRPVSLNDIDEVIPAIANLEISYKRFLQAPDA